MSTKKNPFLRLLVPVLVLGGAVGVFFAVASNTGKQGQTNPGPATTPTPPTTSPTPSAVGSAQPAPSGTASNGTLPPAVADGAKANPADASAAPAVGSARLRAKAWPVTSATQSFKSLGSTVDDTSAGAFRMEVVVSPSGAGVESIQLANHRMGIEKNAPPEMVQSATRKEIPLYQDGVKVAVGVNALVPFALLDVTINGATVGLFESDEGPIWRQREWGEYEAQIVDETDKVVARVVRTYTLPPGSYDFQISQRLENLSTAPMSVAWRQLGPTDLPAGVIRYGGDVRRVRIGYIGPAAIDPLGQVVNADTRTLLPRSTFVDTPAWDQTRGTFAWAPRPVWPDEAAKTEGLSLSWAALQNRYFAVSVHPVERFKAGADGKPVPDKVFREVTKIDRVVLDTTADPTTDSGTVIHDAVLGLTLSGPTEVVAPGAAGVSAVGVYAGPISSRTTDESTWTSALGLRELVLFTFGGPCGFCTFQFLAHFLHSFLAVLHDYVLFDWALGIIVLVVCVRTVLHPVTRWSQVSLSRFSKQMAALGPKQAKLKEKFGHDPQKFRDEVGKLMREENVNYAGALGCLPMFLQTPVWIALSAMIFFNFDLRHAGAFFNVFQAMNGWQFLGDLAEPDKFISFGTSFRIPLLSGLMGPIEGLNVLPLLLGVVFYVQQKYLTPPPTTQMTPEQEQQQKIMKVMMVVMFPVMMYNAPAALALYFMANSTLGILESRWIRKSIDAQPEITAPTVRTSSRQQKGAEPKPGFMSRVRIALEAAQKQAETKKKSGKTR